MKTHTNSDSPAVHAQSLTGQPAAIRRRVWGLMVLSLLLGTMGKARSASIYWGNVAGGDIRRANLDGSGHRTLVAGVNFALGPTLDLEHGKMYWGAAGSGVIRQANLDGTGQRTIISGQGRPGAPALDIAAGMMYRNNAGSGEIRRANLDGTDQRVLVTGQSQPAIIALDLRLPPPLNLQAATTPDAGLTLSWSALMGRAYRVEFSTDLAQTNWSSLIPRLTATNITMTAADPEAADPHRFYRVLLLP